MPATVSGKPSGSPVAVAEGELLTSGATDGCATADDSATADGTRDRLGPTFGRDPGMNEMRTNTSAAAIAAHAGQVLRQAWEVRRQIRAGNAAAMSDGTGTTPRERKYDRN